MKPTDVLMDEHRVIEQVIGCVEKMAAIADATPGDAADILEALPDETAGELFVELLA